MRRTFLSPLLLALAACATSTGGVATSTVPPGIETSGAQPVVRTRGEFAPAEDVQAPLQRVWDALPQVYAELGIADAGQDPATRTVGHGRVVVSRRFAGQPVSYWLSCGATATGSSAADEFRVQMAVRTTLAPSGSATSVRTVIEASARGNQGTSSDARDCTTTGRLEQRIAALLRQKLQT